MANLSDRRGQPPRLILLPVHPSGLRGQDGAYEKFMSHMRAVPAEIAYLSALGNSPTHDPDLRRRYITELEAADTANHERNVEFGMVSTPQCCVRIYRVFDEIEPSAKSTPR
jgi:hypothetical protein